MNQSTKNLLEINLAMLFMSTSGILGRFVPLPPGPTIFWRATLAIPLMLLYCRWRGIKLQVPRAKFGVLFLAALLMATHWVSYFYALKLSSVAIGMLAIFTYPAMTTLLEPLLLKQSFQPRHLGLAGLMIAGVYLLAPGEVSLTDDAFVGLLLGLFSALVYALRNILMKTQVSSINGSVLMLTQVGITAVITLPFLFFQEAIPSPPAIPYLVGLALLTTAVGHTMFLASFKHFTVSTASLLSCVQPVYGILLAVIFYKEVPGWGAVAGGALILSGVAFEASRMMERS